jgi:hypothetical protein
MSGGGDGGFIVGDVDVWRGLCSGAEGLGFDRQLMIKFWSKRDF